MVVLLGPDRKDSQRKRILPLLAIREGVIFPHTETLLTFGRPKSIAAVQAAYKDNRLVALFSQRKPEVDNPGEKDLYPIGTLARIERVLKIEKGVYAWVKGIVRVQLEKIETNQPFLIARVKEVAETVEEGGKTSLITKRLLSDFQKAVDMGKSVEVMSVMRLLKGGSSSEIADQLAYILDLKTPEKQKLLETLSAQKRLAKVAEYLAHEIDVLKLEKSINEKTQKRFDKSMREAVLRERKKTIEQELGESEDDEIKELRSKIKKAKMPAVATKKAFKELKRLSRLNPNHPEYGYIRTYLDWMVEMPWAVKSPNKKTLIQAAKVLDNDHYGLKKVKERIVEYLAVMKLKDKNSQRRGRKSTKKTGKKEETGGPTILCFIGPPGVGKTSIGKSIARALGREFIRVSLGGVRDEAEIRGHRRTYVGALPGRIIQGIRDAGTNNPVFMLDEIDKVGVDFRGDPTAALLEALDPEQNKEFSDHYLEVPFDLSKVMFITTGNILHTIPPALRDRMEIIRFPGYTEEEKWQIAKNFLWKKQLEANGLRPNMIRLAGAALSEIIRRYTREAGVRELERNLATVCRKLARKVAEKKKVGRAVTKVGLKKLLGMPRFSRTLAEKKDEVGIATGLAYTQAGGDIIFIEVALMPGKGKLLLTGKLGKVMKESGEAALSYVRSRWQALGLKKDFYKGLDIHVHIPEGAVPKDGPSAGIAMATALVSALTQTPTRKDVGMTGEITLRGRVLEIGGVKEKVIAAHRAGLKKVILPKNNKKDLEEIPSKTKKDIKFVFVEHMDQVLKPALKQKRAPKRAKKIASSRSTPAYAAA